MTENNQDWFDDASNQDEAYERVRLRKFMADDELIHAKQLASSAQALSRANAAIEYYVEAFWKDDISHLNLGIAKLKLSQLLLLPDEIKLRLLARLAWSLGGAEQPPRWQKVQQLLVKLKIAKNGSKHCLGNCLFIVKQGSLWVGIERDMPATHDCLKSGEQLLWQNRFLIQNSGMGQVKISSFAKLELGEIEKIKAHLKLDHSPKVILAKIPVILDENQAVLYPYKDENILKNSLEIRLQIKR